MPSPSKSVGGERSGLGQAGASVEDARGARGCYAGGPLRCTCTACAPSTGLIHRLLSWARHPATCAFSTGACCNASCQARHPATCAFSTGACYTASSQARHSAACASSIDAWYTAPSPGHDTPPPLPSRQAPAAPPPVRHDTPPLVPSRQAPAASAKSTRMPSPSKSVGGERSGLGQAGASEEDAHGARGGLPAGPCVAPPPLVPPRPA